MRIVEQFGFVWRLSERAYREVLLVIIAAEDYDLDELGKRVGTVVSDLPGEPPFPLDGQLLTERQCLPGNPLNDPAEIGEALIAATAK